MKRWLANVVFKIIFVSVIFFKIILFFEGFLSFINVYNAWLYVLVMSRTRFQSESTLYSCLDVKKLLARSRREIRRWSDCNGTRTQNHLVLKRTLNHLAKLATLLLYNACLEYYWEKKYLLMCCYGHFN